MTATGPASGSTGPASAGTAPASSVAAGRRWLVAGSYPPVPGRPAAATVAAVLRVWDAGDEVTVASPRPSAAPHLLATTGRGLGRELAALGRGERCDGVVLCVEPGWPLAGRRAAAAARGLARGLSSFARVDLVVTGDPADLAPVAAAMAPLVRLARTVTATSEPVAAALTRVAGGVEVRLAGPLPAAGRAGLSGDGRSDRPAPVGPLEPGALLLVARGRRVVSRTARRVLGRHTPVVRAWLVRLLHPAAWRGG